MTNFFYRCLFWAIGLLPSGLLAQTLFTHSTTSDNTAGHITTLNHVAADGKANAILIVSQEFGAYNPHEIGVWYNNGKWKIFNQDLQAMPLNTKFNVLVLENGLGTVHTTTAENTSGHITTLPIKYGANACLVVTQHFGKYNKGPVGVWMNGDKWTIFNENRQPMPIGTKFNILYLQEYQGLKLGGIIPVDVFQHKVTSTNKRSHVTYIDHPSTNEKPNKVLFATQRYMNTYNSEVTGLWYSAGKWSIFNENRKPIPDNLNFNVMSMTPPTGTVLIRPNVGDKVLVNQAVLNKTLVVDPGQWVIKPYTPTKEPTPNPSGSATPASTEIQGPNVALPQNLSTLVNDPQYLPFMGKLNLFRELYEDKNKNANTFYYLPANFNLRWDKDSRKYSFYIYYMSAGTSDRGEVLVTAELSPGINESDITLAEQLISKKLNRTIKLLPMPLKDTPNVNFGSSLTNFGVSAESITINVPTDFLQPIVVSWKMSRGVDDLLGAMMSNISISGNVEFLPYSEADKTISVPVKLKVNDPAVYGRLEYTQAAELFNGLFNGIDYPISLTKLHILRNAPNQAFSVQTLSLPNYEISPGKMFSAFSESERNQTLSGAEISKLWLEYGLKACDTCTQSVQRKILGGTSAARIRKLEVQVLAPIAYAQANSFVLQIRSVQGDPNGKSEVVLPLIKITEDNRTLSGGDLFISEGTELDYAYNLTMIKSDGETQVSDWKKSNSPLLVIGEQTIKQLFENKE